MADSQVGRYQRENDARFAEDAPAEQFCNNCGMYKENCECHVIGDDLPHFVVIY